MRHGSEAIRPAYVGHAPLTAAGACGVALLDTFVDQPTEEPDAACVDEGPGFATPEEIAATPPSGP
ncbi:MAG: hypothetical protein ACR2JF_07315 [Iamia sp.]